VPEVCGGWDAPHTSGPWFVLEPEPKRSNLDSDRDVKHTNLLGHI
jgi:hypothetical protein